MRHLDAALKLTSNLRITNFTRRNSQTNCGSTPGLESSGGLFNISPRAVQRYDLLRKGVEVRAGQAKLALFPKQILQRNNLDSLARCAKEGGIVGNLRQQ